MLKGKMDGVASSVHYDDTTMSADDIADGVLICRVGVAALNPSEFAHFRIRIRLISASHPSNRDLRGKA